MTADTCSQHIGIPFKTMAVRQSATGDRGPVDMTVATGTMARGAVGIVSLDLVLGQLVKLLMSCQPHPLGYFALLSGSLVQTCAKISCYVTMTGSAFLCVLFRRMFYEIPGMGDFFLVGSVGTSVTVGTTDIMITVFKLFITIFLRIKKHAVIGFKTGCLSTAAANRCNRIRTVYINQVFIIGMTPYTGRHITVIRDLVLCATKPNHPCC
jgi:hypothetical protein